MSLYTQYFLRCSKCNYAHFLRSGSGFRPDSTEWVYSNDSSQSFPLLKRLGWCQDCNGIQSHEQIPDGTEIEAHIEDLETNLAEFVSGEWDSYGEVRANHARLIIKNRRAWHEWSRTRANGRCLTCGITYVTAIDPLVIYECTGKLPFVHPGCGGALLFSSDEKGVHFSVRRGEPDKPITYFTYSWAGFPVRDRLDDFKRRLEERLPGATIELRTAISKVISGQAKTGSSLTFRSLTDPVAQTHLSCAVFDFICRELEGCPPDPQDPNSLSRHFPEIHKLAAVLIREVIYNLPSTQRTRPVAAQTTAKATITLTTVLHRSPFHLLSVSTRHDRRHIVAQAEELALHFDAETCQRARSDLTNPRTRLRAELGWLPGISPNRACVLVETLKTRPWNIRQEDGLPALAKANLLAAVSEAVDAELSSDYVSDFIQNFALVVDDIDTEEVLRSINEDRAVSGFPEVQDIDLIAAEIVEHKRYYRNAIRAALNRMKSPELVATMTMVVDNATLGGEVQAPELIDELVDAYAVETQEILAKESQNADKLIRIARESAKAGEVAVLPLIDKLESVTRAWDKIAQPIQLSSKSRGLEHEPSKEFAYSIHRLALDLFNDHDLLIQSQRLINLLCELFSELPEFAERVYADMQALSDISKRKQIFDREQLEWEEEISFSMDIGAVFKDTLSISIKGISWKEKIYPLDSITRVRWGGLRHSVNGIPTGSDYLVAFGDNRTESVVSIKHESIYTKFTERLWRAVCVRLMTDILKALRDGSEVHFGETSVRDDGVTLIRHKFLGSNEAVRYPWSQVQIWSAEGAAMIGAKDDKKTYASLSYIQVQNAHLLEQMIRMAFKQSGVIRLSDLLS